MRNGRTPREKGITNEMLKIRRDTVIHCLKILFNKYAADNWQIAGLILICRRNTIKT